LKKRETPRSETRANKDLLSAVSSCKPHQDRDSIFQNSRRLVIKRALLFSRIRTNLFLLRFLVACGSALRSSVHEKLRAITGRSCGAHDNCLNKRSCISSHLQSKSRAMVPTQRNCSHQRRCSESPSPHEAAAEEGEQQPSTNTWQAWISSRIQKMIGRINGINQKSDPRRNRAAAVNGTGTDLSKTTNVHWKSF